jgi:hypothetical protein
MSSQAFDMVPIQNENDGKVLGVLTEGTFALTPLYLVLYPVMSWLVLSSLFAQPCPIFFVDSFILLSQSYFSSLCSKPYLLCLIFFPFVLPPPALPPSHRSYHPTHHHTGNLTSMMTQGRIQPEEMCVGAMYKQFRQVQLSTSLCELANIFDRSVRKHDRMLRESKGWHRLSIREVEERRR